MKNHEPPPRSFYTLAAVEEELGDAGMHEPKRPAVALPEIPLDAGLELDVSRLTELYVCSQAWFGYVAQILARARALVLELENEKRYIENAACEAARSGSTPWSHESVQATLWQSAEYLALVEESQRSVQRKLLLENVLTTLKGNLDVVSRLFTVRGQEIQLQRRESGLPRSRGR